ncbi:non-hydrolyzing UDP-N-acetylglucosamine 2-epimerase [Azospirillum halopraeferens]|uniref:non-hydrolyzing UDP-N-acetylglucosamine 2-epimerase n=1 Tax=Azospirillum halopraeferens TaxID=34010 RepID=UPI000409495E|nr:UDP-N-acetylglucosamine 2-epimerase (non-hydrolyzing) [Azospirillum halopraeferens]
MKVLIVFGTRPEAIKMAPLLKRIEREPGVEPLVCVTAQHRQMLDQVLALFDIKPHYDLDVMRDGQGLGYITSAVLNGIGDVIRDCAPDRVLVQGDTTTTMAAALGAFYARVPVGHVEAGLRTGNLMSPWPEELNRKLASNIADLHFAPTTVSRDNLLREGIDPGRVEVTGNTVIDALLYAVDLIKGDAALRADLDARFPFLNEAEAQGRRIVLTTGHRRENFDGGLEQVFTALSWLAERPDVSVVFPVHLNPNVQKAAQAVLKGRDNVHLIPPQEYLPFVYLMMRSHLIVTDSGGVQEEAPSLGKPVLVTRDTTERPEAVTAGTVELVGPDAEAVVSRATRLLDDAEAYRRMSRAHNPYGDGRACDRIVARLLHEVRQ